MNETDNNPLSLSQAARQAPGNPHPSALWRWCRAGVKSRSGRRVYLAHERYGGRIFVRPADLERFARELAEADREHFAARQAVLDAEAEAATACQPADTPRPRTARRREREIQRAEAECRERGI